MPNHQLQISTLNGQPISSTTPNRQRQRFTAVRNQMVSPRQPLKKQRWYAGFRCQGNPQGIVDLVTQKVQNGGLSHLIPLIRLEKSPTNQFYLFVAIESETPGVLPEEFETYLKLPCFRNPAVKGMQYFTYEQIKPMVGQAHKVEEYTNPIPFEPPSIIFDPLSDFEIVEKGVPLSSGLNLFFDWLSATGYGSWSTLQSTVQNFLKIEKPSRVVRNLKLLGHLETSANGKKWSIAPTALVPLNHDSENLEFYLCGQQNNDLRQQLAKLADIKEEGQPTVFGLPRRKVIFSDRSTYNQLNKLIKIPIHKPGNIAQNLAECLPTLEEWQTTLPVIGGVVPSQRYWRQYQPETQNFQECGLPEQTGFYEMRREADQPYADRTLFYEAETQTWRQADWYGLRFLALYHSKVLEECRYYPDQKQLEVLSDQRWPQLYERALVLASGYLPQVSSDRLWLRYHNITQKLADTLTQKLSIYCQGL